MFLVTALSSAAIAFGLGANLPQISRMLRTRSAGGQSAVGWGMGAITNLCLAYVNLAGLGAVLLGAANLATVALCGVAIVLIRRFGAAAKAPAVPADHALDAMLTQELALTREAVEAAQRRRDERRAAQRPATEPADMAVAVA